jgi:hypothetical protein
VAGESDQSRLVLLLEGRTMPKMPPEGSEPPTPEEIELVRAWIDGGAKGPTGAPPDPTRLVTPQVPLLTERPRDAITAIACSPRGDLVALAAYGEVRLATAGTLAVVRVLGGCRGQVNAVSFSADGSRVVAAAGQPGLFGEAAIFNAADGAVIRSIVAHRDSLYAAVLSPDGTVLATAGYDEQIRLWDAATGAELRTLAGHNGAVYDLAFRPDGKVLASASADRTAKLWDVATGARLETFGQALKELYTVAFSPDGRRVAAAGVDNRIRVWQVSDSAQEGTNPILHARFAHQAAIVALAWSPDGRTIASAAEDRSLKLWDPEAMRERVLAEPQPDWAGALAFTPDSGRLIVGRLDGSVAQYETATGQPIAAAAALEGRRRPFTSDQLAYAAPGEAAAPPAAPQVTAIAPRGAQRGVATRVRLSGANLLDISAVTSSDPRVAAVLVPADPPSATEAWLEVTPAADLVRGPVELSVVTPGGASGGVKLYVDDLPQAVETEPNATSASATALTLPAGMWGVLEAQGDVDCFAIEASAGQTLVFDLAGATIGSKANLLLTLVDAQGRVVASANDFDGQPDPLLAHTFLTTGRYTVTVTDQALTASPEHIYRLTAGNLPFVTGCYPLSVRSQATAEVELVGYNLPPDPVRVPLAAGGPGELAVPVDAARFRSRRSLVVTVGGLPEWLEAEPNDAAGQATPIAAPGVANGRSDSAGDVDLFRFEARAGEAWIIETEAARRGSPIDTKIEVLDAAGNVVPRAVLQAVRDSYVTFRGIDSNAADVRLKNWEEMELNQLLYMQGEVCKLFRAPQGPDSGFNLYAIGGKRWCFFDTSATVHALDEPAYIVEAHPPGAILVPTGLPVFPVGYANDDDGERKLGSDSKLAFTAPADGAYLVRVTDVSGAGGDRFGYRLIVRLPRPDFNVSLGGANPTVNAGSGKDLTLSVDRIDGFDGEIRVDIGGLPPGFSVSSPVVIQAGQLAAKAVIHAAADAAPPGEAEAAATRVTATAVVGGAEVVKEVNNLGRITLGERPKLTVRLQPLDPSGAPAGEIAIAPGSSVQALLQIERNGFEDRVSFNVENLPHGIIVDDIGLNGVLIPEKMTERRIFIKAAPWVPPTTRPVFALATAEGNQASAPVVVVVRP